ncbi:MAG: aldolase/citrate lyase family protein [Thermoguttaceae bacterium]|jgi:hypothetical protein|nr:aldolase/citrate lyase family protein [Thermoguttaceae bacterium]
MSLKLLYITNRPDIAQIAQKYGVDRVFVDLEINGKLERQKNLDTVISLHSLNDVAKLRDVLTTSELLTRINPIFDGSQVEIDAVLAAGTDLIMLPMFKTKAEVETFSNLVAGRARTICLIETKEAVENLDEILTVRGIDEYYIGLNDLHLSYGLTFMFELLANGDVDRICAKLRASGKPYGFGGIARINQGLLLANYILSEHYRLGSSSVILARAFCNCLEIQDILEIERVFENEVRKFRQYEWFLSRRDSAFFEDSRELLRAGVDEVKRALELKKKI